MQLLFTYNRAKRVTMKKHIIEVQVSIPEGERSCLCVLVVSILLISTILISDFGIVQRASGADPGLRPP
jgi:hypothetical protein